MATQKLQAALGRAADGAEALADLLRQIDWEDVRDGTASRLRSGGRLAATAAAAGGRRAATAAVVGGRLARGTARQAARRGQDLGRFARRLPEAMPSIEVPRRRRRTMVGKLFNRFTLGFAAGYVLGAKAGHERYEQIRGWWGSLTGNPTVKQAAQRVGEAGGQATSKLLGAQHRPRDVREVMTPLPATVSTASTLAEAAEKMRRHDAGAMIVLDDGQRVCGILTDRDIAVRAVAEGRDPKTTKVGEVASKDLQTLSPTDSVADAVRLMRERDVRRLPVVEDGRPVGVVSIGDLAQERDPDSALADISRAPGNR